METVDIDGVEVMLPDGSGLAPEELTALHEQKQAGVFVYNPWTTTDPAEVARSVQEFALNHTSCAPDAASAAAILGITEGEAISRHVATIGEGGAARWIVRTSPET